MWIEMHCNGLRHKISCNDEIKSCLIPINHTLGYFNIPLVVRLIHSIIDILMLMQLYGISHIDLYSILHGVRMN